MPLEYWRLSSDQVASLQGRRDVLAVIPVGSLEQHCRGPLGLDSIMAEKLARAGCTLLEREGWGLCVILPTMYYGFSPEWLGIPGTITLSLETFAGVIKDIVSNLVKTGLKRIAVVNAHGGNKPLLESLLREHVSGLPVSGVVVGIANYWELAGTMLGHSDELERSLALYLGINVEGLDECQGSIDYAAGGQIISKGEPRAARYLPPDQKVDPERVVVELARFLRKVLEHDPKIKSI